MGNQKLTKSGASLAVRMFLDCALLHTFYYLVSLIIELLWWYLVHLSGFFLVMEKAPKILVLALGKALDISFAAYKNIFDGNNDDATTKASIDCNYA